MSKISIEGAIDSIDDRTNRIFPLIEAIVNGIDAILERRKVESDHQGQITVNILRSGQIELDHALPKIIGFKIIDDGIGFTESNRDSFDTFYSRKKIKVGGKGFGRFMYIKFFNSVKVESVFNSQNQLYKRTFGFGRGFDIIENEKCAQIEEGKLGSNIVMSGLLFPDKGW